MMSGGPVNSWMENSSSAGLHAYDFIPFETIRKWFIMVGGLDTTPFMSAFNMCWRCNVLVMGVDSGMNVTFHFK